MNSPLLLIELLLSFNVLVLGCSFYMKGCDICSTYTGYCTSCLDGYYLNGESCSLCYSACRACYNYSYCYDCKTGYYYSSQYGSCVTCPLKCSTCTASGCTSCQSNNTYISLGMCAYCPQNCDTCTNSASCLQCSNGFSLTNDTCSSINTTSSEDSSSITIVVIIVAIAGSIAVIIIGSIIIYRRCKPGQDIRREAAYSDNQIRAQQPYYNPQAHGNTDPVQSNSLIVVNGIEWRMILPIRYGKNCAICLDDGNAMVSCGHISHIRCLNAWVPGRQTCPFCRSAITNNVTIICSRCNRFGFFKPLNEVIAMNSEDIKLCGHCRRPLIQQ